MSTHFQNIEDKLLSLIASVNSEFSKDENQEVYEFIDAGEYGLALEALVEIIIEENKKIAQPSMTLILELADLMELNRLAFSEKLSSRLL